LSRLVEEAGIATVVLSAARQITEMALPPRAAYVRYPLGNIFGEAGNAAQQRTILRDTLALIDTASTPGVVVDLPYRWRRSAFP
jgi:D-proline reductase (dithiol) PrdB